MVDAEEDTDVILVCFCPEFAGDPPIGHFPGEGSCKFATADQQSDENKLEDDIK